MSGRNRLWRHLAVGLVIAAAALYLTYRKTDAAELGGILERTTWPLLLLVLVPLAMSYVFRIIRWRVLLSPVRRVSAEEATGPLLTGFMVNSLLPGRVGELARALLLSRRTGVSRASSFATVVLARLFDGLTLAAMTLLALAVLWSDLRGPIRTGLIGAAVLYLIVLAVLVALGRFRQRAVDVLTWPLRKLGLSGPASRLAGILASFVTGLEALRNLREVVVVSLLSLCVWLSLSLSVLPVFWAMHLQVEWYYPVLVLILAGLGMLIPTPAGTGTVHGALVLVLPQLTMIGEGTARVLALLFHTTQFLPIILVGIVAAVREGISVREVERIAEMDPEADPPEERRNGAEPGKPEA